MRWYLPNIARFPSVDPLTKKYPWNSVYAFAESNPIEFIDLDGGERKHYRVDFDSKTQKPVFTFLKQENIVIEHPGSTDLNGISTESYQTINDYEEYVLHKPITEYLSKEGVEPQAIQNEVTLTVRDWNQAQSVQERDFPSSTWGWIFAQHAQNMRDAGIGTGINQKQAALKPTLKDLKLTPLSRVEMSTIRGKGTIVNPFLKMSEQQLKKSYQSFKKLIAEHEQKLEDWLSNPEAFDHKKLIEKNPSHREKIVEGRAVELKSQIKKQRGELEKIERAASELGISLEK